ncbi:MAG: hypothetical protein A2Z57_09030 [Planctomycetes bacterium RIFCSPHIGHO2_12_39_6]|nr:MAG: hypothetical protein A2Z57_09030 [Planctomycetes bacterium RIFCSPHIGHO2_12_39_6]
MSVTVKKQKWTYGDYLQIDDNNRYEIYKGELIMVPAPSSWHQRYSRNIEFLMWSYVKEKGLGEVLYAPLDVIFTEDNVYQPDIVFVSKENMHIIKDRGVFGAPDLIVEIISPGTAIYDVVDKREIYEGYGVKELWFVNPDEKAVEVLVLKDGVYKRHSFARKKGEVCSQIIEGFKADLKDVFCIDK